jgi:streptomycin 6-kinase
MRGMSTPLEHYLNLWNLSDPQPLAQTVTSHVYTVTHEGERVVLKLLSDVGDEERVGAIALRHWNGHGAVQLIHSDDSAHLMEYADGESLDGWVKRGEDAASIEVIAGVLNQLHSVQTPPPEGLYPLERWFRDLFAKADEDEHADSNSVFQRGARVARALLADPHEVRVLHGDIHHENVRQSGRGWLAFDPKGLVGERTYDTANTLCNLIYRGTETDAARNEARILQSASILSARLGIERVRILTYMFAYCCLSAAWSLRVPELMPEEDMASHTLQIAALVEPHISPL